MGSIIYNGHEIKDLIVNGNHAQLWLNGQKLYPTEEPVDPYNPLGLPPFTIRCKFSSGYTPTMGNSRTLVDSTNNVWDITKNNTSWSSLFKSNISLLEVIGANSTGVTDMSAMFRDSSSLTSVSLFDTSSCTNMVRMFHGCKSLTSIPLFDTHNVTDFSYMCFGYSWSTWLHLTHVPLFDTSSAINVAYMFGNAKNVESGALALYQQMSTQANPPSNHSSTFTNCGSNTTTGAAELAQIPKDWGGTMA